jgi:hypothetical protein
VHVAKRATPHWGANYSQVQINLFKVAGCSETVNCLVKIYQMINRFIPQRSSISKLSKLQKRILEEALKAHWREPIHRACGSDTPGRFFISKILEEFFGANKEGMKRPFGYRRRAHAHNRLARERLAAPRAALAAQ